MNIKRFYSNRRFIRIIIITFFLQLSNFLPNKTVRVSELKRHTSPCNIQEPLLYRAPNPFRNAYFRWWEQSIFHRNANFYRVQYLWFPKRKQFSNSYTIRNTQKLFTFIISCRDIQNSLSGHNNVTNTAFVEWLCIIAPADLVLCNNKNSGVLRFFFNLSKEKYQFESL